MPKRTRSRRRSRAKVQRFSPLIAIVLVVLISGLGYAVYLGVSDGQANTPGQADSSLGNSDDSVKNDTKAADPPPRMVNQQLPARLKIGSIGVDAPIVPVGVESDGAMAAPKTASDIGWYEKSAKLGSSRRAMLLSGHYGLDTPEVLRRLSELKVGDRLVVEGAEGDALTFEVAETERKHRTEVDMEKAFNYAEGEESVSVITCIGEFDYGAQTYKERHIVYAIRIE